MKCTRGDAAINVAAVGGNGLQASRRRQGIRRMPSKRGRACCGSAGAHMFLVAKIGIV